MRRKGIAVLVFALTAVLMVAGCGSKKKSSASTSTTSKTTPATVGALTSLTLRNQFAGAGSEIRANRSPLRTVNATAPNAPKIVN